jgi:hypothetical protein
MSGKMKLLGLCLGLAVPVILCGCNCASRACSWIRRPFSRSRCEVPPTVISPSPEVYTPSPIPMEPLPPAAPRYETGN